MNEQDFLLRIATRLGRKQPLGETPRRPVVGAAGLRSARRIFREEIIARFCAELEALGGVAIRCETTASLRDQLSRVLQQLSPQHVACWEDGLAEAFNVEQTLSGYQADGRKAVSGTARKTWLQRIAEADIGITGCDYAVAETGTVVLLAGSQRGRAVSLLPSVHIVLVRGGCIRMHLGDVLHELGHLPGHTGTTLPAVNFISGPSRSSDIENDLSIGVHGPAALYALILEG